MELLPERSKPIPGSFTQRRLDDFQRGLAEEISITTNAVVALTTNQFVCPHHST